MQRRVAGKLWRHRPHWRQFGMARCRYRDRSGMTLLAAFGRGVGPVCGATTDRSSCPNEASLPSLRPSLPGARRIEPGSRSRSLGYRRAGGSTWRSCSLPGRSTERRSVGLRIAMLAPVAWRVPPRHYGPWEQFASLLTEGLVERGVDVTLFASGDSRTSARLASAVRTRLGGGPRRRAEGGRVPPHLGALRARRRVRPHPQQLRLPAADLQRAGVHAGADHDPWLLVAAHRRRLREVQPPRRLRRHQRRRPPSPPHYLATIHHGIDTDAFAFTTARATTCCSSAASIPTRAPPTPSTSPAGPGCRWSSPGSSRISGTTTRRLRRHIDGRRVRYVGAGRARSPAGRARRRRRAAAPHRLRGAVRVQRGRGDGVRHTGHRVPAWFDAGAHRSMAPPASSSTTSSRPSRGSPSHQNSTGPRSREQAVTRFGRDRMADDYLAAYTVVRRMAVKSDATGK